jgi:hypothetical protein
MTQLELNQHDLIQFVVISKNAEYVSLKFSPGDPHLTSFHRKNIFEAYWCSVTTTFDKAQTKPHQLYLKLPHP